MILILNTLELT